jgi:putative transposase
MGNCVYLEGFPKNTSKNNLINWKMKKSKFSESQIIKAIKENESGRSVDEISRELGINPGTFYNWRKKYSGMEVSHLKRLKELESENVKLKKMFAEQALQLEMAKDVISKKW